MPIINAFEFGYYTYLKHLRARIVLAVDGDFFVDVCIVSVGGGEGSRSFGMNNYVQNSHTFPQW